MAPGPSSRLVAEQTIEVRAAGSTSSTPADRLDDDDYPAFTMRRAAEMIGATPAFLRAWGEAKLIVPPRSDGGHRRYSRYQLRLAARAREMADAGAPIDAAYRIIILEDQLEEAQRINNEPRKRSQHDAAVHGGT